MKKYWEDRYNNQLTGWDIGHVSSPIEAYIDQLLDKSLHILIPGAGFAYEAEYFYNKGFNNVHVVDIAQSPLARLKDRCPDFPDSNMHCEDFFLHQGQYDLIIEQTFFCAIDPSTREKYLYHIEELLSENGKFVGLLFDMPLTEEGPPFGGERTYYQELFSKYFKNVSFERCYNSIKPRVGNELWFSAHKKY
ncbi:MAG: SAM-dependent methyltransferase [Saprospiraceae bacterium]|nr:SAM-dependent methyltransferase [Bacteroidia bacterium]NNE16408.1 SAM-dependent methyltransferase [Saprospiraceae bacterium]